MATHSSILAWRIPGTEEPGRVTKNQTQVSDEHNTKNKSYSPGWPRPRQALCIFFLSLLSENQAQLSSWTHYLFSRPVDLFSPPLIPLFLQVSTQALLSSVVPLGKLSCLFLYSPECCSHITMATTMLICLCVSFLKAGAESLNIFTPNT